MDSIVNFFNSYGLDFWYLVKIGAILLLGTFLCSVFGRFIFGKRSALNNAVSSTIGILFIYAVTVVIKSFGVQFHDLLAPLPYVAIDNDQLILFSFTNVDYTVICTEIVSMIILAFLMNITDRWMPTGKNIFTWIFFRSLSIVIALVLHIVVTGLFTRYLPQGIITYAPTILLALLILMLLTGALKIPIGIILSTVNPLIAALYTFFFANVIGKQITRAVLTTALLTGLLQLLHYVGASVISIASAALIAYIPFILILVVLWFIVCRFL